MGILSKLKNGDTVFRSLSYEKDRPNGGTSNAPYIQTPLPDLNQNPGPPNVEDTILRGSLKAPISAKDDVLRLTKYLFDIKNINGYLFTVKQNLLSRTAVKTEASFGLGYGGASKEMAVTGVIGGLYTGNVTMKPNNGAVNEGIYNPLSTIMQAGVGYLGTHYNKQGLDPTGTIPTLSINKYQDVVSKNNKSIPEDPKVPFSLIKKSQRANLKSARKVSSFLDQQTKTNAELNVNFQGLSNLPFSEFNQQTKYQKAISAFLSKWDQYLDKRATKKLDRKSKAADEAIAQSDLLNKQVESAMNAPKVYTNRLLKLMDDSGLNPTNPFESISSVLYSYGGGPDSTLGIGGTNIKFATKNDGITPSRTNILPFESSARPQITYLLDNIFGDDSVSISYTNLLNRTGIDVNEVDLFSSLDYFSSYNSSPYFNAPWDTQDVKIIDSLRETPNGTKVSYYQKEYTLNTAKTNSPQIPITKNTVYSLNIPNPSGATNKFLSLYGDSENAKKLEEEVFFTLDENPNHQSWAAVDPLTDAPLANRASEETDPYAVSQYSEFLTPNEKTYLSGKARNSEDLKFTTGSGTIVNFDRYTGASKEFNTTLTSNQIPFLNQSVSSYFPNPSENLASRSDYSSLDFNNLKRIGPLTEGETEFYRKADKLNTTEYHPSYEKTRREETAKYPGRFPNVRHEFRVGTGEAGRVEPSYDRPLDTINAVPVYQVGANGIGKGKGELNDFVHFRIGIVNGKNNQIYYMNFRSYIDSFSDSFNSNWTDIKYMGRGESFKRYSDFGRTINMSFTVAATSQAEMYGIYDKLRLLATSVAPSYTNAGYMTGNFAKLTVGGYVFEQYGIITGFTYDVPQESSWELTIGRGADIGDELPMMVKVTGFTFIPIYDFIPQFTDSEGFRWLSNRIPTVDNHKNQNKNYSEELNSIYAQTNITSSGTPNAEVFNSVEDITPGDINSTSNTGTTDTNNGGFNFTPSTLPSNPSNAASTPQGPVVNGTNAGGSIADQSFFNFNI